MQRVITPVADLVSLEVSGVWEQKLCLPIQRNEVSTGKKENKPTTGRGVQGKNKMLVMLEC